MVINCIYIAVVFVEQTSSMNKLFCLVAGISIGLFKNIFRNFVKVVAANAAVGKITLSSLAVV